LTYGTITKSDFALTDSSILVERGCFLQYNFACELTTRKRVAEIIIYLF